MVASDSGGNKEVVYSTVRACFLLYYLGSGTGLFNALVLDWVSPKCHTLMQTAVE